jgi:hypothetical protein
VGNKYVIGIRTLGVILCICGAVALGFGIFLFSKFVEMVSLTLGMKETTGVNLTIASLAIGLMSLIVCVGIPIAIFLVGIGLMRLKEWARKSAFSLIIFFLITWCIGFIAMVVKSDFRNLITAMLWLSGYIVILYFLSRPKVKEQFNQ